MNILDAYKKYHDAGFACVPTSKIKSPAIPKGSKISGNWSGTAEYKKAHGIGIICGELSGGVECIDFDNHFKDSTKRLKDFGKVPEAETILKRYKFVTQKTVSGGYHIIYKCNIVNGSEKLASRMRDGKPDAVIESRGTGNYFCVDPTPGYKLIINPDEILDLPVITPAERDLLFSACRTFNEVATIQKKDTNLSEDNRPGDIYDQTPEAITDMIQVLLDAGWKKLRDNNWRRPGKDKGISATMGVVAKNVFNVFSSNASPFEMNSGYTPFQVVGLLKYHGDFSSFAKELAEKQTPEITIDDNKVLKKNCPYIRVGISYFKIISMDDRYGIAREELKYWTKDTLITDYGRKYPKTVPKYDTFIMQPDNLNYQRVINNCYNLYNPFSHTSAPGDWTWTRRLLEHVFGQQQYKQGLRYMQILYRYPERQTVILVLVSQEKMTGKTTFLNWLAMLFGDNFAQLSADDFMTKFNFYGKINILAVEETLFEKKLTMERLKALTTQKQLTVNEKNIPQYTIPYFGKVILTSNYEDKFALIDAWEIRFFVRKLAIPVHINHSIEDNLLAEIPAFLDYLQSLPPVDWSVSRSGFTADELKNEYLTAAKEASKHEISQDLRILITDYFDNHPEVSCFYASAIDIKNHFFQDDNRSGFAWIKRALKENFDMAPEKVQRYILLDATEMPTKIGRQFKFLREDFTKETLKDPF